MHGLALPSQVPLLKPVKPLLSPAVAVIVTESPTSATQVVTPLQPAALSLIVALPLPLPLVLVLIVTVWAKLAVSVSPLLPASNVHGFVVPLQLPLVKPVKLLPDPAAAVIVIESFSLARQLVTPLQPAAASLILALPLPAPLVAVAIVTVCAKLAVSVSPLLPA